MFGQRRSSSWEDLNSGGTPTGLMDWWIGGLVDWWIGGFLDGFWERLFAPARWVKAFEMEQNRWVR